MKRLKTRAQFDAVLGGAVLARTQHFVLHGCSQRPSDEQHRPGHPIFSPCQGACIGAMVPKRWARRAVTRNLVKRQIYTLAQEHLRAEQAWAYVVRLRQGFAASAFSSASSLPLKHLVSQQLLSLFSSARVKPSC